MNKKKEALKETNPVTSVLGELHNFIDDLFQLKTGEMFRVKLTPESVIALQIPNYFTVISRPMDLITIKEKLTRQQYKYPSEIEEDLNLMFDNCFHYNANTPKVLNIARKFRESVNSRLTKLKLSIEAAGFSFRNEIDYNVTYQLKGEQRYEKEHEQVLNKLTQTIRDLYHLASACHFKHKITDEYLIAEKIPQYKMIIKHPMDLITIAEKFVAKKYRTVGDIISDFYLMIDNFFEFNKQNEVLIKTASKFKSAFEKRWKKIHHFLQGAVMKDKTPIDYKAAKFNITLEELLMKIKGDAGSVSLEHESSVQDSIFHDESATKHSQIFWDGMQQMSETSRELSLSQLSSYAFHAPPKISKGFASNDLQESKFAPQINPSSNIYSETRFPPFHKSIAIGQRIEPCRTEKNQTDDDFVIDLEESSSENKWKLPLDQQPSKSSIEMKMSLEQEAHHSRNKGSNEMQAASNQSMPHSPDYEDNSGITNPVICASSNQLNYTDSATYERSFGGIPLTESVVVFRAVNEVRVSNVQMEIENEFENANLKDTRAIQEQNDSFELPHGDTFNPSQSSYPNQLGAKGNDFEEEKNEIGNLNSNDLSSGQIMKSELQNFEMDTETGYEKQGTPNFHVPAGLFDRPCENEERIIKLTRAAIEEAFKERSAVKIEKYKRKLPRYIRKLIHLVNKDVKVHTTELQALKEDISQMNEHDSINYSHLLLFISYVTITLEHQAKKSPNTLNERAVEMLLKLMSKLLALIEKYLEIIGFEFKPEETVQFNEKRRRFRRQIEADQSEAIKVELGEPVLKKNSSIAQEKAPDDKEATKIILPTKLLGNLISTAPPPVKKKEDAENIKIKKAIEEYIIRLKASNEKIFGKDLLDRIHDSWRTNRTSREIEPKIEEKKSNSESEQMTITYEKEQPLSAECTMVDDSHLSPLPEQQVCFSIKKPTNQTPSKVLSIFSIEDSEEMLTNKTPVSSDFINESAAKAQRTASSKETESCIPCKSWNHGLEQENLHIPGDNNTMIFNRLNISGKVGFNIRNYCKLEFIHFFMVSELTAYVYGSKSALDQKKMQEWKNNNIKVHYMYYENTSPHRRYPYSKLNFLKLVFKMNLKVVSRDVENLLLVTGDKAKFKIRNVLSNETANVFMNLQRNMIDKEFNLLQCSKLLNYEQADHQYYELSVLENTVNLLELPKLSKVEEVCAYAGVRKFNQEGTLLEGIIITAFDDLNNLSIDLSMGVNNKNSKLI